MIGPHRLVVLTSGHPLRNPWFAYHATDGVIGPIIGCISRGRKLALLTDPSRVENLSQWRSRVQLSSSAGSMVRREGTARGSDAVFDHASITFQLAECMACELFGCLRRAHEGGQGPRVATCGAGGGLDVTARTARHSQSLQPGRAVLGLAWSDMSGNDSRQYHGYRSCSNKDS